MQKELPPIFGRTDINTLPLSDTHEKSLCFQYLWELLFLHLIPDFCHSLISVLWSRFFGNQFDRIYCRGCHTHAGAASVLYKGLGLSQQAKRTRPGWGQIRPFCGSVATLPMLATLPLPLLRYLSPCYVTSPLVPLPPSSVIIVQIGMPKLYAKDRKFLEKRKR